MIKKDIKAIIIAAGKGVRLRPFTHELPKSLLNVGKRTIIGSQIKNYYSLKIKNINIIVGYKKEKFKLKKIQYFNNLNYKKNNILQSLFCAKKVINNDCIISYSDIIFDKIVVKKILNTNWPISIVVDTDWKKNYVGRTHHPHTEAEKAYFNSKNILTKIGKNLPLAKTNSEFIGMIRLNNIGCDLFKKYYQIAKKNFKGKKFYNSKNFDKAYLTDFMKFLIDNKIDIKCVKIRSRWMEIDTTEDLVKAQNFFKQ
tara:strand:- start:1273 stop:2037 length:765 start_codon:yes stop_codon:yes gene_type:complete